LKNRNVELMIWALAMVLSLGNPTHAVAQDAQSVVHPAPASNIITVTVSELRRASDGQDKEVMIAQAAGFPNDTCDVITTFDVVKSFEERQTWKNIRQKVEVEIDGNRYPARFRDIGFYPLGLNLACIDFDSPQLRSQLQLSALPLEDDSPDVSHVSYDDVEIAKSDPGTPFLNQRGEISSVLIATPNGPLEFASPQDIRRFLNAAAGSPSGPILLRRPLSSI